MLGCLWLLAFLSVVHSQPVSPPIFPEKFAWILHLVEDHHYIDDNGHPKIRTTTTEGQYFWDYSGPLLATRQQNVVLPTSWRPDIPWNVYLGIEGVIRVGVFNYTGGTISCALKGLPYGKDYWPRDFLRRPEVCSYKGIEILPTVFGGAMQDGKKGFAYFCRLPALNMTTYVDITSNQILRVAIDEHLPVWNKQIWDTVVMLEMEFPKGYWDIPAWFENCPK